MKTKKFRLIKSSIDGICGGESKLNIEDVFGELCNHKGWDSRQQLITSIENWARTAKPGDVFKTNVSIVVACR